MACVPKFIFDILEKELYDMQCALLHKVAEAYDLDAQKLIASMLKEPIAIVPNTKSKVEVVRRMEPKPVPPAKCRCMARIWNRGKGGQCTRARAEDQDLCSHHLRGALRHGRVDDPPPKDVFASTNKQKALYK
jgi:hypothetical protein